VKPAAPFCRDPDDDLIVATAVVAMADRLVTGDNDLLILGEHHGVRIVTPRQFLDEPCLPPGHAEPSGSATKRSQGGDKD
jgi:predicted nucleic acid-binding protein